MEPCTTISLARRSPEQDDLQAMIDKATSQFIARGGKVERVGFRMKDATVPLSYGRTGFAELVEVLADPQGLAEPAEPEEAQVTPPAPAPAPSPAAAAAVVPVVKPRVRMMAGVAHLPQPAACDAADSALADSLAVRAYYGDSLAAAARRLGESITRCGDVARRYDVRFGRVR